MPVPFESPSAIVWRKGVILEDDEDTIALVREEDRVISVSVTGKNKTNFISRLRETLNNIFNSYQSDKPELQYRVERFGKIPLEVEEKKPLWLPDNMIFNQSKDQIPFYEHLTKQMIDLNRTLQIFNISSENLMIGGQDNQILIDNSTSFNFHQCNIGLQGSLNDLSGLLSENGNQSEAKELKNVANILKEAKQLENKEEIQESGVANRLKRFVDDLGDEKSKLHKTIKGIKHGVSIAQDIAKGYNNIAQWVGLPQVPKPFLKKEKSS